MKHRRDRPVLAWVLLLLVVMALSINMDANPAFWARVDIRGPGECWPWQGAFNGNGYGRYGKVSLAHRHAYELTHGPIPKGKLVLHGCDNPPCCNPAHLKPGTPGDNIQDMLARGRHYSPFTKTERARHGFPAGGPCRREELEAA